MIDPLGFIKANFNIEYGNILMFDVPASRFNEFNQLYGTSFAASDPNEKGSIRISVSITDFIDQYKSVFKDLTEKHKKSDILTKLLHYDERKGIGNAPFFRYKIIESLRARQATIIEKKKEKKEPIQLWKY